MIRKGIDWLREEHSGLAPRIAQSGVWAGLLNVGERGLRIGRTFFLARLLSPEAFGWYGIALLAIGAARQFTQTGLRDALIHHSDEDIDQYLDSVWVASAVRGVVLAVVLWIVAGPVAGFFGEPASAPFIRILAFSLVLEGLVNPAVVYYRKDLEFSREFVYRMSGAVGDFITAIVLGVLLGSIWALVFAVLARWATQFLLSHLLTDHTVGLDVRVAQIRELFDFGKWLSADSVLYFVTNRGDDAFVGWLLGASPLGLYQISYRLSNLPATEISHVVSSVTFPAFSKVRENTAHVRSLFERAILVIGVLTAPMSVGLYLLVPEFTALVLGSQWLGLVPAFRVLIVMGVLRAVVSLTGPLYKGISQPELGTYENLLRLAVIVVSIWPLTNAMGIQGAAISVTLGIGASFVFALYQVHRILGLGPVAFLRPLSVPVVAALVMGGVVFLVKSRTILGLVGPILLGACVYAAVVWTLFVATGRDPQGIVAEIWGTE